eukprot:scaffold48755_cov35-Tisochrysis_lutea.AAC.2
MAPGSPMLFSLILSSSSAGFVLRKSAANDIGAIGLEGMCEGEMLLGGHRAHKERGMALKQTLQCSRAAAYREHPRPGCGSNCCGC